ncbi:apolipoprotein N-acyltransferase [Lipingzhangella sp. LS1_29]|uniref:Apolipoprotein N-acyltransferase n=1 Tax=Lipingzhangella rawalii TaxID=2055835 RepID=A0ABU2H2C4_9ACTN|nr:apolipoprotein N-acyltransferase [Lipingzhangella rawalii]MDS1268970.1 apolipoprotein N-acyltransferase [Lipingzhangella rawalii]
MVAKEARSPDREGPQQPQHSGTTAGLDGTVDQRFPPEPAGTTLLRAGAAAGSGLAQLLALPPYGLWYLAPLSATLLLLAVRGVRPRRAAWLGALAGAALMVPLIRWQAVFGFDVWLLIAAAETAYFIPMAVGIALAARLPGWIVWTSALWVAQELVRARWPLGGFPWGKLAFSQPDTPFTGYAAVGSSALVTFAVAATGALIAAALLRLWRQRRPDLPTVILMVVVAGIVAGGTLTPRLGSVEADRTVTAGIVQGNVPGVGEMDITGERREVLNNHVAATHELADAVAAGAHEQPDMVILPENASDIDPYRDADAQDAIQGAADAVDAPLLIGVTEVVGEQQREVQSVVWEPEEGPGETYVKRYLVPFGEYIPYRDFFTTFVSRLDQVGMDAIPGTDPGALDLGETRVATAICFDVAFDAPVRQAVAEGGEVLVVPTNNANYNFTGQSEQQLAITQLRAVEHGRAALVSSTSGISAVVEPDGSLSYVSAEAQRDIHVANVPAMQGHTPATSLGAIPEWAITLVGVGALAVGYVLQRRAKRGPA